MWCNTRLNTKNLFIYIIKDISATLINCRLFEIIYYPGLCCILFLIESIDNLHCMFTYDYIYTSYIGSNPLLGAAILFSILNAKRNRKKFLANVETRKGLQLVDFTFTRDLLMSASI